MSIRSLRSLMTLVYYQRGERRIVHATLSRAPLAHVIDQLRKRGWRDCATNLVNPLPYVPCAENFFYRFHTFRNDGNFIYRQNLIT